MAYKTLIFGTDDLYPKLKFYYEQEVKRGNLEIVAYAVIENGGIRIVKPNNSVGGGGQSNNFELAIISSIYDFYRRMKFLEAQGIPRSKIIDGCAFFKMSNLDVDRLINEGVASGVLESNFFSDNDASYGTIGSIHPRVYKSLDNRLSLKFDTKGYIGSGVITNYGLGLISVGKFTSISVNEQFKLSMNGNHDYRKISTVAPGYFGWSAPEEFSINLKHTCKILIGNDVWIGRECVLV